jgi:predicted DsbA family dithiol-disulfide isomerase
MKIEIWSDIACPFCYIGKHHLQLALQDFSGRDDVMLIFRSFELNASAPKQTTENIYQQLAQKYGMSLDEAKASTQRIAEQGRELGLTFNFDKLIPVNTFDAHRLIHLAAQSHLATEMTERIFKAFFSDGENIADGQTLTTLAEQVGITGADVQALLTSDVYSSEVRADEADAGRLNITSVPFFVFNGKYALSGAQPVAVFQQVLQQVQQETPEARRGDNAADNGPSCQDGSCSI